MFETRRQQQRNQGSNLFAVANDEGFVADANTFSRALYSEDDDFEGDRRFSQLSRTSFWLTGRYLSASGRLCANTFFHREDMTLTGCNEKFPEVECS